MFKNQKNIVKMYTLSKAIYVANTIPNKIQMAFFKKKF